MTTTQVQRERRYTRWHPCPICAGHVGLASGKGIRCAGFLSNDEQYAHCTREDYAGDITPTNANPPTYAHRLNGPCRCGKEHGGPGAMPPPHGNGRQGQGARQRPPVVSRYELRDAGGALVGVHGRKDFLGADGTVEQRKQMWWEQHNGRGSEAMPLYNLPALLKTAPGSRVTVTEGEKSCEVLTRAGVLAVGTVTGAESTPCDESLRALVGYDVALWSDNDTLGREHMQRIAARLVALGAPSPRWVDWPDAPAKGDAADYFAGGGTLEQLASLVRDAPPFYGDRMREGQAEDSPPTVTPAWPVLAPEAYYGVAGDTVHLLEPHTEADPVALLVQFLVAFGNIAGRHAYFLAEADRHYPKLFAVLIGDTAKARKGTSWGQVKSLFQGVADSWLEEHITSGLSSGEGLIYILRDPTEDDSGKSDGKKPKKEQPVLQTDKRLLVREGEFASVLKVMAREGNRLSPILRDAFDDETLCTLTKNSPDKASATHVSVIGHITREELRRSLSDTEAANGLGNRFLWLCVKRSKLLPDGGALDKEALVPLRQRIAQALTFAHGLNAWQLTRDPDARSLWHQIYARLSEGYLGLYGALTARAEAQVMRLASVYALLDREKVIRVEHLRAALAVWDYAEASVRFVFGDALGDPTADAILHALRDAPGGLTRTEISALFGRHAKLAELDRAFALLVKQRLARSEREQTEGRSIERWYAVTTSQTAKEARKGQADGGHISHNSLISQQRHIQPDGLEVGGDCIVSDQAIVCLSCGGRRVIDYGDGVRCIACDILMARNPA